MQESESFPFLDRTPPETEGLQEGGIISELFPSQFSLHLPPPPLPTPVLDSSLTTAVIIVWF